MTSLKYSELLEVPELQESVTTIVDMYRRANKPYRQKKIPEWRKAELYWSGIQRIWWSDADGDWRYPAIAGEAEIDEVGDLNDRTVNIYRAHGESIIAALSVSAPGVRFFPDDAEDEDDIRTAAAYEKIAEIVRRQMNFPMLYIKALFILYQQDYIAGYVYNEQHEDYGFRKEERYTQVEKLLCPECGTQMEEGVCLECDYDGPSDDISEVSEVDGYDEVPKTRTLLDVFGGTHIDIIPYARKQRELPYLFLTSDVHFSAAVQAFGEDTEELQLKLFGSRTGDDDYERESRLPVDSHSGDDSETVEIRECWVRPWAYYILGEGKMDRLKELKTSYPKGIKATFVNDELVKLEESELDKHWVIAANPLSNSLIGDSLGKGLLPIQDMTSELNELTMQTIEHGIPLEFADSEVIDFDSVNDQDQSPGNVYPAVPRGNRSLADSFHTTQKASLSREVAQFNNYLNISSQFVTGDVPAVHGGPSAGSKTASEYAQSKQSALQRLGTNHRFLTHWSAQLFNIAARLYVDQLSEDEKYVSYRSGSYFNVWIRQKDLQGTIGHVEAIGADTLPSSPDQLKETILRLLEMQHPVIEETLFSPENVQILSQAVGFADLTIPGEDDRTKQWAEIHRLVSAEPTVSEGQQDQQETSSVPVDPLLDNHGIEASICASFLKSAEGQDLKDSNPQGYQNVLLHYREHIEHLMEQQEAEMMVEGEEGEEDG